MLRILLAPLRFLLGIVLKVVITVAVLVAAVAGAGYWLLSRPLPVPAAGGMTSLALLRYYDGGATAYAGAQNLPGNQASAVASQCRDAELNALGSSLSPAAWLRGLAVENRQQSQLGQWLLAVIIHPGDIGAIWGLVRAVPGELGALLGSAFWVQANTLLSEACHTPPPPGFTPPTNGSGASGGYLAVAQP